MISGADPKNLMTYNDANIIIMNVINVRSIDLSAFTYLNRISILLTISSSDIMSTLMTGRR